MAPLRSQAVVSDTITLTGIVGATIDGASDADILTGGAGDDFIDGNLGDDTIDGGDGADTIAGSDGNDVGRQPW